MKTALGVSELTLQSVVVLPMGEPTADGDSGDRSATAAQLPILSTSHLDADLKIPLHDRDGDDHASEAATVSADDDADANANAGERKATALGFVERLVREYAVKREIHALVFKKQQQLRHMQTLMASYQEQLTKSIEALYEQARGLNMDAVSGLNDTRIQIAEMLATGVARALVENARSLGLVLRQRQRLLVERTQFRLVLLRTRQEECEWLLKSIVAQHDKECEMLLSASTAKKYLEEGSLQATLAVQIAQDDPIFAPVERLFESQPHAKQLQLQLDSVDSLIAYMQQKGEDLAVKEVTPSEPAPLMKRASLRERRLDSGFPTGDRKRALRLCLLEGKRIRSDRANTTEKIAEHQRRYAALLCSTGEVLYDVRTRTGCLLHHFVEKLHHDTMARVRVTSAGRVIEASNQDDTSHRKHGCIEDSVCHGRYIVARLPSLLETQFCDNHEQEELAVDSNKLPPPAMITAFTKFLARVVTTEYELISAPPYSVEETTADTETDPDDLTRGEILDQTVLRDCVHDMVFRRISAVASASAIHEYRFNQEDEPERSEARFLYPWHWQHSKSRLQGLSPFELAFPDKTMVPVVTYLMEHTDAIRQFGFLPETLALFRSAERETTPKGVVRAVMAGFKMLHREITEVLTPKERCVRSPSGNNHRRPMRRGSTFLNADVLIPSVVLMMTRLPHASYLDGLWHRVMLVEAFRSSALSEGGEESYYLTCLAAAMEFISTFESSTSDDNQPISPLKTVSATATTTLCSQCDTLRGEFANKWIHIEEIGASTKSVAPSPSPTVQGRPRLARAGSSQVVGKWSKQEHESIKQLSKWISDQPPSDGQVATLNFERFVAQHELWTSD